VTNFFLSHNQQATPLLPPAVKIFCMDHLLLFLGTWQIQLQLYKKKSPQPEQLVQIVGIDSKLHPASAGLTDHGAFTTWFGGGNSMPLMNGGSAVSNGVP